MKSKILKSNKGLSIIEVVAAILIITMGMVGVLSLVIQNIRVQYIDKNVLIASGLAQEGLELVRNVRDLNWLTPDNSWDKDLVLVGLTKKFIIDYGGRDSIQEVNSMLGIDDPITILKIDGNGRYWHGAGTPSLFKRMLTIEEKTGGGTTYLDIKCTIRWTDGNQNHDYTAETYLYDWR